MQELLGSASLHPLRHRPLLLLLLAVVLAPSWGFGPPTLVESDAQSGGLTPTQVRQMARLALPDMAAAFLLKDADTGLVLLERNAQQRRAPASLTKIMTALVALERGDPSAPVAIKWQHMVGGSLMGLSPGDVVSLEGLLWGLLLPSGNDAALAIAEHIAGSEEEFVALMNTKAAALGLRNTHFLNPHGLDEPGHYSTAADLALLTEAAFQHPLFARIVATRTITVWGQRPFILQNGNELLFRRDLPGIDGVKTGYTEEAGHSLIFSLRREGRRLIGVVLGAADREEASAQLLRSVEATFRWQTLPEPAPYLLRYEAGGVEYPLHLGEPLRELLPPWWQTTLRVGFAWEVHRSPNPGLTGTGIIHYYLGEQRLPGPSLLLQGP